MFKHIFLYILNIENTYKLKEIYFNSMLLDEYCLDIFESHEPSNV